MTSGLWPRILCFGAISAALILLGLFLPAARGVAQNLRLAQITVEQTLIVRVPRRPAPKPLKWKMKKGPKCVAMSAIAGAAVVTEDAIDLALKGGQRMRAQFSSGCPALDYYSGFYILPTADGRICANRDMIRTRAGGQCEIERFRRLALDD